MTVELAGKKKVAVGVDNWVGEGVVPRWHVAELSRHCWQRSEPKRRSGTQGRLLHGCGDLFLPPIEESRAGWLRWEMGHSVVVIAAVVYWRRMDRSDDERACSGRRGPARPGDSWWRRD